MATDAATHKTPRERGNDSRLDPLLNWDILKDIMLYCCMEDASRISRTCRTLLQSAPRVLLSGLEDEFQAVALDIHSHLPSFHQFMLSGRHDCFHLLRRLRLSSLRKAHRRRSTPEDDVRTPLVGILQRTTKLEFLGLDDAEILEAEEGERTLLTTLLRMKTLRTLQFENTCGTTFERLRTMEAPLTGIYATFGLHGAHDVLDPVRALAPFRTSLQVLDLFYVMLPHGDVDVVYPQLTSLSVRYCTTLHLQSAVRCFPRLQELRFKLAHWEPGLDQGVIERHREQNAASQKCHTWPSLRRIRSTVIQLYTLAICCKVEYIDACEMPLAATANGRRLAAVLADARPACLALRLQSPGFDLMSLAKWLTPASDGLRALKLHIELVAEHGQDNPLIQINTMLTTFTELHLHCLDMHVEWESGCDHHSQATDSPDGRDPSGQAALEIASPSSCESGMRTIALDAAKLIPTLRFVAIQTSHAGNAKLFEISDGAGGPTTSSDKTLVKLSAESRGFEEFYNSIMYKPWVY
ncbi:hypothetical protein PsYK624_040660 [Phanerochaete sordida]|uniref:Uncharacterized protein n=1 Tax=Phanerochaete sordida TaxID=48140 RepID=A0A9P3G486_9APHY|nr:hypothetical protein PsYK624_040660 [Phanerochaete sordida]